MTAVAQIAAMRVNVVNRRLSDRKDYRDCERECVDHVVPLDPMHLSFVTDMRWTREVLWSERLLIDMCVRRGCRIVHRYDSCPGEARVFNNERLQ